MARLSYEESHSAVTDALTAAGGRLAYADLKTALETAGKSDAIRHIRLMADRGDIFANVESQAEGRPINFYSLTAGVEA